MSKRFRSFDILVWSVIAIFLIAIAGLVVYDGQNGSTAGLASDGTVGDNTIGNGSLSNDGTEADEETAQPLRVVFTKVDEEFREQLYHFTFDPSLFTDAYDPEVTSAAATQISSPPGNIWDFTANPGRSQIVYSLMNQDSTSDLWWLTSAQTEAVELLPCEEASCNGPALSPDGRFLAFTKRSTATVETSGGLAPPRLWLLSLDSGETAQVFADNQTLGFSTSWSASSQWISFLTPGSNGLGLYNLNDAQRTFFETQTGELGVWHPSEDRLLISKLLQIDSQYLVHLYLADPATEDLLDLSEESALVEDSAAAWAPDGEWIAFLRRKIGEQGSFDKQLWVMRKDGSDARALTAAEGFDHGQPQWSPDGRYLLYHRFPLQGPDITLSIWITDLESGAHLELARPGQRPQWG